MPWPDPWSSAVVSRWRSSRASSSRVRVPLHLLGVGVVEVIEVAETQRLGEGAPLGRGAVDDHGGVCRTTDGHHAAVTTDLDAAGVAAHPCGRPAVHSFHDGRRCRVLPLFNMFVRISAIESPIRPPRMSFRLLARPHSTFGPPEVRPISVVSLTTSIRWPCRVSSSPNPVTISARAPCGSRSHASVRIEISVSHTPRLAVSFGPQPLYTRSSADTAAKLPFD